jgi:hypothetical protein
MRTTNVLGKILNTALSIKRPHGSQTNVKFTQWLREQLPLELNKAAFYDGAGNLHVDNRLNTSHRTLFVAHVDTVHRAEGKNKIAKTKTHWRAKGDVLGADDGAGVALLMHMIWGGVRGYYVFTQGEERGGVGARYLADKMPDLLREFDRAIAFDRRGIDSVITHQGWGRCCSDTFGTALAGALMDGNDNLMMLNDDTGVYTDTAEFTDIIPECTNISVGYAREHTQEESLDLIYYQNLAAAVLTVDWDSLPVDRDPSVVEPAQNYAAGNWWQSYKTTTKYEYEYDPANDEPDFRREDAIDAVLDAQYGHYDGLTHVIAESVWPDDTALALRHMSTAKLPAASLDWALECLEHGEDVDLILGSLYDELYVV